MVPYVTAFAIETLVPPVHVKRWVAIRGEQFPVVEYADETPWDRDERQVLWERVANRQEGEPRWKEVNSGRQRRCMRKMLCQICGDPIDQSQPIPWLIHDNRDLTRLGAAVVNNPPVCLGCMKVAKHQCPRLHTHGWLELRVHQFEWWGYEGNMATEEAILGLAKMKRVVVHQGAPERISIVARQLTMCLTEFQIVDTSPGVQ